MLFVIRCSASPRWACQQFRASVVCGLGRAANRCGGRLELPELRLRASGSPAGRSSPAVWRRCCDDHQRKRPGFRCAPPELLFVRWPERSAVQSVQAEQRGIYCLMSSTDVGTLRKSLRLGRCGSCGEPVSLRRRQAAPVGLR